MSQKAVADRVVDRIRAIKPMLRALLNNPSYDRHVQLQQASIVDLMAGGTFDADDFARISKEVHECALPARVQASIMMSLVNSGANNANKRVKLQDYVNFVNYITPRVWVRLESLPSTEALALLNEYLAIVLYLRHPSEKTFQILAALHSLLKLGKAHVLAMSDTDRAMILKHVKTSFRLRVKHLSEPAIAIACLHPSPSTLLEMHPEMQDGFGGEIPSVCKIDHSTLEWVAELFPMRGMRTGPRHSPTGNGTLSLNEPPNALQVMQQTMQQMMNFMQQHVQSPRGDTDNIGLTFCTDSSRSRPDLRDMLSNGPPTQSPSPKEDQSPRTPREEHVEPRGSPLNAASPSVALSPPELSTPEKDGSKATLVCADLIDAMERREETRAVLAKEAAAKKKAEIKKKKGPKMESSKGSGVAGVKKKPAAKKLGCSKCRYLKNGCSACR